MLKKLLALATTTAMLGANAAAQALNGARAMVRTVTGPAAPATEAQNKARDGKDIQPSIPPLPPEPRAPKASARAGTATSAAGRKLSKARAHAKRPSHRKPRKK